MDEKICPICGKPNNCKYDEGNCWCKDVVVPKKVLDMVPDDKKERHVYANPVLRNIPSNEENYKLRKCQLS